MWGSRGCAIALCQSDCGAGAGGAWYSCDRWDGALRERGAVARDAGVGAGDRGHYTAISHAAGMSGPPSRMVQPPLVRLALLGPMDLRVGVESLTPSGQKQRALLCMLAVDLGRVVRSTG